MGEPATHGVVLERLTSIRTMCGMKILVVDDERAVRESLRRALQLEGYEVALAGDGEALEALRRRRRPTRSSSTCSCRASTASRCAGGCARTARDADPDAHGPRRGRATGSRASTPAPTTTSSSRSRSRSCSARVRALLRRLGRRTSEVLRVRRPRARPGTRQVTRGGEPIALTRTEFALLELSCATRGRC